MEIAEIISKQELYGGFFAADYKWLSELPSPVESPVLVESPVYPYEVMPEEDVELLQKLYIGMYPEKIGDLTDVNDSIQRLKSLGFNLSIYGSGLSRRERQFIYHFQEGATTTDELADRLKTSKSNIRFLRSSVENRLETQYQPDRTLTPRQQKFLDSFNAGFRTTEELSVALGTNKENIRCIALTLREKGFDISFSRKKGQPESNNPLVDAIKPYLSILDRLRRTARLEAVRAEITEISDYQDSISAVGGV